MQVPKRKSEQKVQKKFDPVITQAKFNELEKDYQKMVKIIRPKLAAEVERLGQLGDFSENAEYQIAKGKLRGLNNRIDEIKYRIDHAQVIEPSQDTSQVRLGHFVTIEKNGEQKTYQILGSLETNPGAGAISASSPLGKELLGGSVGDVVEVKIGEQIQKYKIIKIK